MTKAATKTIKWTRYFHLPEQYFASDAAYAVHRDTAVRYNDIVDNYKRDGDEISLYEDLTALLFSNAECQWHAENRGKYLPQAYATAGDIQ